MAGPKSVYYTQSSYVFCSFNSYYKILYFITISWNKWLDMSMNGLWNKMNE
jgi:hypothetical protein